MNQQTDLLDEMCRYRADGINQEKQLEQAFITSKQYAVLCQQN